MGEQVPRDERRSNGAEIRKESFSDKTIVDAAHSRNTQANHRHLQRRGHWPYWMGLATRTQDMSDGFSNGDHSSEIKCIARLQSRRINGA